jgi:hypothetical protein
VWCARCGGERRWGNVGVAEIQQQLGYSGDKAGLAGDCGIDRQPPFGAQPAQQLPDQTQPGHVAEQLGDTSGTREHHAGKAIELCHLHTTHPAKPTAQFLLLDGTGDERQRTPTVQGLQAPHDSVGLAAGGGGDQELDRRGCMPTAHRVFQKRI